MDVAGRRRRITAAVGLYDSGRYADAARAFQREIGEFGDDEQETEEFASFCGNFGSALAETGDLSMAVGLFTAALEIYRSLGLTADAARIHVNLGNVYRYTNSHQPSYDSYRAARTAYREAGDRAGEAQTLLQLAHLFLSWGVPDQAEPYLDEAADLGDVVAADPLLSWSLHFQHARVAEQRGDLPGALTHLEAARESLAAVPDVTYRQETEAAIAQMREALGQRFSDAELAEATAELASVEVHHQRFVQTVRLARSWHQRGDRVRARALYDDCLAAIDRTRSQLDYGDRFRYMEQAASVVHEYCRVLLADGDVQAALEVSERGQGRSLLDLMFRHQLKRQGGRRFTVGGGGRIVLGTPTAGEIRSFCARHDLHLLKMLFDGERTMVWLVDPAGKVEAWNADGAYDALERVMASLWWGSPFGDDRDDGPAEIRASSPQEAPPWENVEESLADLWAALLPERLRARLEAGRGRLLVVPHDHYGDLPWSMIGPRGAPLGERWEIGLAPSVAVALQLERERDVEPWSGLGSFPVPVMAFGGVGAQEVDAPIMPAEVGEGMRPTRFADLPGTVVEAARVAATLGGAQVTGALATPEALRLALGAAAVVHIAAHGFWNPLVGDLSFVLLAPNPGDGESRLFQHEVVDHVARAELVVLSGCQTGLGSPHPDTYITLANAFLIAGVRCVLVGLWPIRDDATVAVAECFYRHLRDGASPAGALRAVHEEFYGLLDPWDHAGFTVLGNPFCTLGDDVVEPMPGPVLCGGDTMWMRDRVGEDADLTPYANRRQTLDEGWLVDQRGVHVIEKGAL